MFSQYKCIAVSTHKRQATRKTPPTMMDGTLPFERSRHRPTGFAALRCVALCCVVFASSSSSIQGGDVRVSCCWPLADYFRVATARMYVVTTLVTTNSQQLSWTLLCLPPPSVHRPPFPPLCCSSDDDDDDDDDGTQPPPPPPSLSLLSMSRRAV